MIRVRYSRVAEGAQVRRVLQTIRDPAAGARL